MCQLLSNTDKRREYLLYLITFIVLTSAVANFLQNDHNGSAHIDPEFYNDMREFVKEGPRNTAKDGYTLCLRVAHLEAEHHNSDNPIDCYAAYFGERDND